MPDLLLGLIGDNIARSKAPLLHRLAGRLCGLDVRYERLVPREMGADFDAVFRHAASGGFRGINVTYPYKELAAARVTVEDPLVRAIGAVNTVVFPGRSGGKPKGYNTDYSGFVAAYRGVRGKAQTGAVGMIGAGGVGKAVAFGLLALGCDELRIAERDLARAEGLARALADARRGLRVSVTGDAAEAARGAAGLINCTPVGMVGHPGTPLPRAAMPGVGAGAGWAFDAVYTPVDTEFLRDAAAEGLAIVSGYELFFHQGVDAWALFSGRPVDPAALRAALAAEAGADAGADGRAGGGAGGASG
jgi:shikimate dehydrogenase